jgi:hypothetical protein
MRIAGAIIAKSIDFDTWFRRPEQPPTSILLSQIPRDLVHTAPKVKINLSPRKIPPKAIFHPEALRMKVVRFEIFRCNDLTAIIDPRGAGPPQGTRLD